MGGVEEEVDGGAEEVDGAWKVEGFAKEAVLFVEADDAPVCAEVGVGAGEG